MRAAAVFVLLIGCALGVIAQDKPVPPPLPAPPVVAAPAAPPAPAANPGPAEKATPTPAVPPDPAVEALIKDLGSDDYRTREKAGKALEAKGDKALPHLRNALAVTDNPEAARRLTVLVRKMEHDRLVSPRRVTLAMKDKTPKDYLDEIAKQTGYKIEFGGGGGGEKYTFTFTDTPFWEAVDRVANAAGMVVYSDYDDETIRVYAQNQTSPFVTYAGPFRIVATSIGSSKNLQLSGIPKTGVPARGPEGMNLQIQVQSEPKNPLLGAMQAEVLDATDEFGGSLAPPRNNPNNPGYRSGYYSGNYRSHNVSAYLNLVRGNRDATTIKTLRGRIPINLLAGIKPEVIIPDPMKVKNKKFAGRTVEIELDSVTEAGGNYTVTMSAVKVGATERDPDAYNWGYNLWQRIELVDEKGNKYRSYGYNNLNQNGPHSVQMTVPFGPDNRRGGPAPKLGPPVKLIFNEWVSVTHEVTFEFKDVPLP